MTTTTTTAERSIHMFFSLPTVHASELTQISDWELEGVHDYAVQALCAWNVEHERRAVERKAEAERERQRAIRQRLEANKYAPLRVSSRTLRAGGRPYPMYRPSPSPTVGGTTEGDT